MCSVGNWPLVRRQTDGCCREGPVFAGLEFGGFFDVPHRVSIKKSAIYGPPWNRIGNCPACGEVQQMDPNGAW